MKTRSLFWGLFFITLGVLYLLDHYASFSMNWEYIADWWPLIFIFWGLSVVFKNNPTIRPITTGITGFWLAVILFTMFLNVFFCDYDFHFCENDSYKMEQFQYQYNPDIEEAKLIINGGAGKFAIKNPTDNMVFAKYHNNIGEYYFDTYEYNNREVIKISQGNTKIDITELDYDFENKLEVQLNKKTVWDIELNIGAATTILDLSDYKVRNLDLNTGATKTKIKLGNLYKNTEVDVEMGAASIVFDIPESSGCKITGDMILVAKNLDGFVKKDNSQTYYVTRDFNQSDNKIHINVDGGVSSIKVKRY